MKEHMMKESFQKIGKIAALGYSKRKQKILFISPGFLFCLFDCVRMHVSVCVRACLVACVCVIVFFFLFVCVCVYV